MPRGKLRVAFEESSAQLGCLFETASRKIDECNVEVRLVGQRVEFLSEPSFRDGLLVLAPHREIESA